MMMIVVMMMMLITIIHIMMIHTWDIYKCRVTSLQVLLNYDCHARSCVNGLFFENLEGTETEFYAL